MDKLQLHKLNGLYAIKGVTHYTTKHELKELIKLNYSGADKDRLLQILMALS